MQFKYDRIIHSHSPDHQETSVAINATIYVKFTRAMKESTLNAANVILFDDDAQSVVPCTLSYDSLTHTLSIIPSALEANKRYTVTLRGASEESGDTFLGIQDIFDSYCLDNYSWYFTTGSRTSISTPTPLTPTDKSSISIDSDITFSWREVEGADHYEIQVCKDESFLSVYWPNPDDGHMVYATSVVPDTLFDEDEEYFWRVRAVDSAGFYTQWCDTQSFYYGSPADKYVSPEDVPVPGYATPSSTLYLYNTKPEERSSNIPLDKLGSIEIVIAGNVPESYVSSDRLYVYSEGIDGHKYFPEQTTGSGSDSGYYSYRSGSQSDYFPADAADIYSQISVSGEMSAALTRVYSNGYTTITITPTEDDYYKVNNRYFVCMNFPGLQGYFWFTSRYEPLMSSVNRVRGAAKGLLDTVDDDIINYVIREKSLNAIEQSVHPYYSRRDISCWTSDHECPFDVKNPPRYVREYVTYASICDILNAKIVNTRVSGDVTKELGDLSISRKASYSWAKTHKSLIESFEKERDYYENWIKGHTDPKWATPRGSIRDLPGGRFIRSKLGGIGRVFGYIDPYMNNWTGRQ